VVVDLNRVKKNETVILQTKDNRLEFAVSEAPNQYRLVGRESDLKGASTGSSYYNPRLLSDESDLYDFD